MKFIISILLIFSLNVQAKTLELKEGDRAPFAGLLLDRLAIDNVNIIYKQYDAVSQLYEKQLDMTLNLHNQNKNYEEQNSILKKQVTDDDFWTKALYAIGGALVGGLVVKTVGK